MFVYGSGSSPRNRFVAERLRGAGLATVLVDLLTSDEERAEAMDSVVRAVLTGSPARADAA